ncbi:hypothetical protein [Microbacterium luticocti]|uniref:hypothetical protein n=1 Tax=Microbacterium luticocti TaxID=451764 RepID=UPI00048CC414|nr:hypothetical protein [Microbacterium luticocti]
MSRRVIVSAAVIVLGLLTGCAAQPASSPTPSPRFTSEADAYKAAEDTYRAYVDALNSVDTTEAATFGPVFALTTAEQNSSDKKALTAYHAAGVTVSGKSKITKIAPAARIAGAATIELAVCLDVSAVEVTNKDGSSRVNPDRVDVQSLAIHLDEDDHATFGYLISLVEGREGEPAC